MPFEPLDAYRARLAIETHEEREGTNEACCNQLLTLREVPVVVLLYNRLEVIRRERVYPPGLGNNE